MPNHEYKNKSLIDKIRDMSKCKKISKDINDWQDEIPWMTGYFTGSFMDQYCTNCMVSNGRKLF